MTRHTFGTGSYAVNLFFLLFIQFRNPEDAKKALEQLNGFELAGRPMKVGNVTERTGTEGGASSALDTDEMDRAGIDLGATGRLQLMAKLAEGQSRLLLVIFDLRKMKC